MQTDTPHHRRRHSGAIFFRAIATQLTLLDIHHASERPKSPLLGEAGRLLEGYHPLSGWPGRPPPETGKCYARNVCNSRVCPAKVSTIRIFLANKRQKFSSETHVTVDASIHIRPTFKDNIFGNVPGEGAIHTIYSSDIVSIEYFSFHLDHLHLVQRTNRYSAKIKPAGKKCGGKK